MTNHIYMDDTPSRHLYTAECQKCKHRPVQGEPDWVVMQNIRKFDKKVEEEAKKETKPGGAYNFPRHIPWKD